MQVCSTDKNELKSIIIDKNPTEESKSKCVHRSENRDENAKNEADHEEPSVTYNLVVKEPIYFNIFERGNNILNKLDMSCKRACMATSRYKYYTKMYETLIEYNNCNDVPLSNVNIQDVIHKGILTYSNVVIIS